MQRTRPASFDLIVAADVFIYIGKLDAIFRESSRLLRPNGLFAFSVEVESAVAGESREVVLDKTCRYRHDANYLRRLAVDTRLMEAHFSQVVIRTESERPSRVIYACTPRRASNNIKPAHTLIPGQRTITTRPTLRGILHAREKKPVAGYLYLLKKC